MTLGDVSKREMLTENISPFVSANSSPQVNMLKISSVPFFKFLTHGKKDICACPVNLCSMPSFYLFNGFYLFVFAFDQLSMLMIITQH